MRCESEYEAATAELAHAVAAFVDDVLADAVDGEVVRVLDASDTDDGFIVRLLTAEHLSDPAATTRSTCLVHIDGGGRILHVDRERTT